MTVPRVRCHDCDQEFTVSGDCLGPWAILVVRPIRYFVCPGGGDEEPRKGNLFGTGESGIRGGGPSDASKAAEGLVEVVKMLRKGGDFDVLRHTVETDLGDERRLVELRGKAFWRIDRFA